jgi:TPR repeat
MMTAEKRFRELVAQDGSGCLLDQACIRRVFAQERFDALKKLHFRTDSETDKLSCVINDIKDHALRQLSEFFGFRLHEGSDIYVGVIREDYPGVSCTNFPDQREAVIVWQSGTSVVFPWLSRLLQRMTATEIEHGFEINKQVYLHCWQDLLRLAEDAGAQALFPEMFVPVYLRPPENDLPDYKQPQVQTFFSAISSFLIGHELGHVFLEFLQSGREEQQRASDLVRLTGSASENDLAYCEEMLSDDIGMLACIGSCLERWSGRVKDAGFVFSGGTNGDQWGGARNAENFQGYLSDIMSAVWFLFYFQEALGHHQGMPRSLSHPPARSRIKALLEGPAGSLLSWRTSFLTARISANGAALNHDLRVPVSLDEQSENALLTLVRNCRRITSSFFPLIKCDNWALRSETKTTKEGSLVWFPDACGGVYKQGIPPGAIVSGSVIEHGEKRKMTQEEFQRTQKTLQEAWPDLHHSTDDDRSARSDQPLRSSPSTSDAGDADVYAAGVAYYTRGAEMARSGQVGEAVRCYSSAIHLLPCLASAYFNRGNAYQKLQYYEAALGDYRRTVALDSNHFKAHCNLGTLLAQIGKPREALPHLQRAAELGDEKAMQLLAVIKTHITEE